MRICEHCHEKHESRHVHFCNSCYYGLRRVGKEYQKRISKTSLIGTPCENCQKVREKTEDIENRLCRKCYIQKRYKDNPALHINHKKTCRDYCRKERGTDVNLPLLHAPPGTGYIGPNGYKRICKKELKGHLNAGKKGTMFEHTYVMSQHLCRPLYKHETIHHKNGTRHDNRLENLELRSSHHGAGQRVEDKIEWCKEFLNIYGYDVIKR